MDIRQLRYFATVARLGSFSRAAGALNMTQPALSKQVGNLEESLHKRLLVRNGRGVTTTEAGQRLLRHAKDILEMVAHAEADVMATGAGRFAIGLPFTIAATIGTELTARLRAAEPSANLAVIQGRSQLLMESLCTGSLDVAIMFKPQRSPLVTLTSLVSEELYLMASPRAARSMARQVPLTLEALCELPLVAPSRPNAIRQTLEDALARINRTPNITMEIDNLETIVDVVSRGAGFAVLSNMSRNLSSHRSDVVPLKLVPPLTSEICMAVSSRGSLSQANWKLLKLTSEIGKELLEQAIERRMK